MIRAFNPEDGNILLLFCKADFNLLIAKKKHGDKSPLAATATEERNKIALRYLEKPANLHISVGNNEVKTHWNGLMNCWAVRTQIGEKVELNSYKKRHDAAVAHLWAIKTLIATLAFDEPSNGNAAKTEVK